MELKFIRPSKGALAIWEQRKGYPFALMIVATVKRRAFTPRPELEELNRCRNENAQIR